MSKYSIFFVTLLLVASMQQQIKSQQNVKEVINSVSIDSLWKYVGQLSGESEVKVNGETHIITSRYYTHEDNEIAGSWIKNKFQSFGLNTTENYINKNFNGFLSGKGKNIIAVKTGSSTPRNIYLLSAHYDSVPSTGDSPGADDNATGVATVLEAARVLSKLNTNNTIIFAALDEEEPEAGLYGSKYFVFHFKDSKASGDTLLGVINMDMIGYDGNKDNAIDLHTQSIANSVDLANKIVEINKTNNIGLTVGVVNPGSKNVDTQSFWEGNYSAVTMLEDTDDFNPNYHKSSDRISSLNKSYFEKAAKLVIASIASFALPLISGTSIKTNIPVDYSLMQNFPNQFNPSTRINFSIAQTSQVRISIYNILGQEVTELVNEEKVSGNYVINWRASNHSSGIYFCRIVASSNVGNFIKSIKMILLK